MTEIEKSQTLLGLEEMKAQHFENQALFHQLQSLRSDIGHDLDTLWETLKQNETQVNKISTYWNNIIID